MTAQSPLVSTEWLADEAGPGVIVLDASVFLDPPSEGGPGGFRSGLADFIKDGHIPGAQFADLFFDFSNPEAPLSFTRPEPEQFARAAGRLGITPQTHVVVYDRLVGQWASRLWWVFRSLGHERISVLDGGLKRYVAQGRPLETGEPSPRSAENYTIEDKEDFVARKADILDIVEHRKDGNLICLLKEKDFAGTISVRRRAGHIPGSVNLPFNRLLDPETNRLKPVEALREAFSEAVPLDGRRIITYCGGGIASTLGALALAVIGYTNTAEYDGSLAEWATDDSLPLELGPATAG